MNRREFLKCAALATTAGMAFGGMGMAFPRPKKKPNFLFILVDDLGWTDLGCYGSKFYETPNIDRLCKESMKFTDGYAAGPVCSPTRASILTGKYPARMGTTAHFGAPQPQMLLDEKTTPTRMASHAKYPLLPAPYTEYLPLEEITLADALKEGGYSTLLAGKWHLGKDEKYWPEHQGFDINKGGWRSGMPKRYFSPYSNPRLEDGPKGEHLPDRLATETVRFMGASKDQPFLAYLSFYSVHTPLMSRKDLQEKYEKKRQAMGIQTRWIIEGDRKIRMEQEHPVYAGMVEAMDQAVGKVLDALKTLELDDNTIVFFMSDNGGEATEGGSPTTNRPLRAGKGFLYEGGIREPLMVKWPGVTRPGSVCSVPVTSTDFYPTMLEMAGLPLRPKQHADGVSWVPLLKGKTMQRGPLFWHYPHYGNQGGSPGSAVRDGDWKLIEFFEPGRRLELYHLKDDIGETTNLVEQHPDVVKRLHTMLKKWRKKVDAKYPTPNPNAKVKQDT